MCTETNSFNNESAVAVYDVRHNFKDVSIDEFKAFLPRIAKKWCFQIERGDNGYEHYQGRISLIKKRRKSELLSMIRGMENGIAFHYIKPTVSKEHLKTAFYCLKEDTRIDGPYRDTDEVRYIPRQFRNKMETLRPFQKHIWDTKDVFNDRYINFIYCMKGNNGKTVIASLCELYANGIDLPPVNDSKELIQSMCDICVGQNLRNPNPVFIDLPRAIPKDRLFGIFTACEQIKKGKLYDLRYKYKAWWIDSPNIWVISNAKPNLSYLSIDRWKIWTINEKYELVKYEEK